jgi:hypothetical protein
MVSWIEKAESSFAMVQKAVVDLKELNPQHELLKYVVTTEEERVESELDPEKNLSIMNEFWDRFWGRLRTEPWQDMASAIVEAVSNNAYYDALQEAIRRERQKREDR